MNPVLLTSVPQVKAPILNAADGLPPRPALKIVIAAAETSTSVTK